MLYKKKPFTYVRSNPPQDAASQEKYLQAELKKLEESLAVVVAALMELQSKVA